MGVCGAERDADTQRHGVLLPSDRRRLECRAYRRRAGLAEIPASHLSDALGDLLAALVRLVGGDSEARFSWDSEPAEYRWILRRDGGEVAVRILWFYDIYKSQHDEAGKLVFETRQPLAELRRVIAAAAAQVLVELGEDGYRDHWVEHPFPTAALRALAEE
jgi:hypothetical protein